MTEERLQKLLDELRSLRHYKNIMGDGYYCDVIDPEGFPKVEIAIRQFLLDNHDSELGELSAKVYAYEKIIANSNFAPILDCKDKDNKVE